MRRMGFLADLSRCVARMGFAEDGSQFTFEGTINRPGKFQGCTVATLWFYEAMVDGDGETVAGCTFFACNEDEAEIFGCYGYTIETDNEGFVWGRAYNVEDFMQQQLVAQGVAELEGEDA